MAKTQQVTAEQAIMGIALYRAIKGKRALSITNVMAPKAFMKIAADMKNNPMLRELMQAMGPQTISLGESAQANTESTQKVLVGKMTSHHPGKLRKSIAQQHFNFK